MASGVDGKVVIDTQLNNKGFTKGLSGMKSQLGGLKSIVGKLGAAIASAFAVKAIINFGQECVSLGSSISEVQNVVDTAFDDMAYKAEEFANTAIEKFGMSRLAAKKTASTYMAMAKGMGLDPEVASDMAISLAGLTGDVASFYNISQEVADTKLKSVFTGETESLKELGVVMTQTNLKAYALKQGITEDLSAMSQAELVALRYGYVVESLALANGDFAKTSDSWANQTRILAMQWEEFMSIVGQALITVLRPCVIVLNQIVASLISAANAVNTFLTSVFGKEEANAAAVTEEIEESVEGQDALTDSTEETAKAQKELLAGFDEINKLGSESDSGATGGSDPEIPTAQDTVTSTTNSELVTFFEDLRDAVQPTVVALEGLWEQLERVGGFAFGALVDFYNGFLVPVGNWVFGEGLPGLVDTISNGLANIDFTTICEKLGGLWDSLAPFAINVGEGLLWFFDSVLVPFGTWVANEAVPAFLDRIAAVLDLVTAAWEKCQPAFEWLWTDVLEPIAAWTAGEFIEIINDVTDGLQNLTNLITGETSFEDYISELSPLQSVLAGIATALAAIAATGGVATVLKAVTSFIASVKSLKAVSLVGKLAEVIALTASGAGTLSEAMALVFGKGSIIAGIGAIIGGAVIAITNFISMLKEGFSWAKEALMVLGVALAAVGAIILGAPALIAGVIAAIVAAVATAVVLIKEHWAEITAAAKACWDWIKEAAGQCWEWIKGAAGSCVTWIKEAMSSCWNWIKGIWSKISGWFDTNVIKPISSGFKSFINGLISGVESFVNFFIRGINKVIDAANRLSFDIPDWVPGIGGETFGFNIPKISEIRLPRLATGAVVPPNNEFMAILGDNKKETEVVSPLSTMKQAMIEAMRESGGNGGTYTFVVNLDGREVARNQVKHINDMTRQAGKPVLLI